MKNGFSVIMPTYNQAFFIRRAILSLQYQTYTQWELIIIDDGSTDYTYGHIKNLIDHSKIRYIRNEQNMGMGYDMMELRNAEVNIPFLWRLKEAPQV